MKDMQLYGKSELSPTAGLGIRRCAQGDREAVIALFRAAGSHSDADLLGKHWEWKYERNPFNPGEDLPIWAAEVDGRLVGVTASFSVPFSILGREQVLAWEADLMVHPDYRARNVARHLLLEKWRHLRVNGIYINRPRYHFVAKAGFNVAFVLPVEVKVLSLAACARAAMREMRFFGRGFSLARHLLRGGRTKRRTKREVQVSMGSWGDPRIDQLWHDAARSYDLSAVRTRPYLNWRYAQCPTHRYVLLFADRAEGLAGFTVLRTVKRGRIVAGYIVDMLARPDDQEAIDALLAASVDHLRGEGAAFATIIATHDSWRRSASDHGFGNLSLVPRKFFYARVEGSADLDLSKPHLWHLTWGDCDHEFFRPSPD